MQGGLRGGSLRFPASSSLGAAMGPSSDGRYTPATPMPQPARSPLCHARGARPVSPWGEALVPSQRSMSSSPARSCRVLSLAAFPPPLPSARDGALSPVTPPQVVDPGLLVIDRRSGETRRRGSFVDVQKAPPFPSPTPPLTRCAPASYVGPSLASGIVVVVPPSPGFKLQRPISGVALPTHTLGTPAAPSSASGACASPTSGRLVPVLRWQVPQGDERLAMSSSRGRDEQQTPGPPPVVVVCPGSIRGGSGAYLPSPGMVMRQTSPVVVPLRSQRLPPPASSDGLECSRGGASSCPVPPPGGFGGALGLSSSSIVGGSSCNGGSAAAVACSTRSVNGSAPSSLNHPMKLSSSTSSSGFPAMCAIALTAHRLVQAEQDGLAAAPLAAEEEKQAERRMRLQTARQDSRIAELEGQLLEQRVNSQRMHAELQELQSLIGLRDRKMADVARNGEVIANRSEELARQNEVLARRNQDLLLGASSSFRSAPAAVSFSSAEAATAADNATATAAATAALPPSASSSAPLSLSASSSLLLLPLPDPRSAAIAGGEPSGEGHAAPFYNSPVGEAISLGEEERLHRSTRREVVSGEAPKSDRTLTPGAPRPFGFFLQHRAPQIEPLASLRGSTRAGTRAALGEGKVRSPMQAPQRSLRGVSGTCSVDRPKVVPQLGRPGAVLPQLALAEAMHQAATVSEEVSLGCETASQEESAAGATNLGRDFGSSTATSVPTSFRTPVPTPPHPDTATAIAIATADLETDRRSWTTTDNAGASDPAWERRSWTNGAGASARSNGVSTVGLVDSEDEDAAIDEMLRTYAHENPSFDVGVTRLGKGWYSFGKPVSKKAFIELSLEHRAVIRLPCRNSYESTDGDLERDGDVRPLFKYLDDLRLRVIPGRHVGFSTPPGGFRSSVGLLSENRGKNAQSASSAIAAALAEASTGLPPAREGHGVGGGGLVAERRDSVLSQDSHGSGGRAADRAAQAVPTATAVTTAYVEIADSASSPARASTSQGERNGSAAVPPSSAAGRSTSVGLRRSASVGPKSSSSSANHVVRRASPAASSRRSVAQIAMGSAMKTRSGIETKLAAQAGASSGAKTNGVLAGTRRGNGGGVAPTTLGAGLAKTA